MDEESVEHLCNAIIGQAIKDYTSDPKSKAGCEAKEFFQSDWFVHVSDGADGESILNKIDRKMEEFQELCRQHKPKVWRNTEEANECIFRCPFCNGKVKIIWGRDSMKGYYIRTYVHQCEVCGIRHTMEFDSRQEDGRDKDKVCSNCIWFKPSRSKHNTCQKHKSYTTKTSFCKDWFAKE